MTTERRGRADLHIHTLASDGLAGIPEILDHVVHQGYLDVIAITDHDRIDSAIAARSMARDRGLPIDVIVGQEVTTLGGHLLALFIERRIRPSRLLRTSIEEIHDQGGIAIPAHPLVPYPLCAQGWVLRRLLDSDERFHPDALEAFNPTAIGRPWHARVVRFADLHGLARVGNSDAHTLEAIASGWTSFPGRTAEDLRRAIHARRTSQHGSFHGTGGQVFVFGRQLRKYGRDWSANARARILRDGSRRDLGFPLEATGSRDRSGER
jgi:predicted metal-dependent phosphoesterase TrpH